MRDVRRVRERFLSKIHEVDGCWLWTGALDDGGYGLFSVGGKTQRAHRVAYELRFGKPRQHVRHKCGQRRCVNPAHLVEGTRQENVADMRRHGTLATGDRNGSRTRPDCLARGERSGSAKLTTAQVKRIRKSYTAGATVRELAKGYGVSKSTISRIVNRVNWGHV